MLQRRGKRPYLASSNIAFYNNRVFRLDACFSIPKVGSDIKVWCSVSKPSIVPLLHYNELHNPICQYERPRIWVRVKYRVTIVDASSMIRVSKGIDRHDLATSAETVSAQTSSTVFQILSRGSSLLDCRCKCALWRCDIEGNKYKSNTLVYGPMRS
jgi:hypothetical protein